jgi:GNAT superfamily N-acetyltransferase
MTAGVRVARVEDTAAIARVHVQSWRDTYRGLVADRVLDDPAMSARRERFWTAVLTEGRFSNNRVAVAEHDGELIGIAMSGRPESPDSPWARQLYVLYVLQQHHGSGAGAALLGTVVESHESAVLWVADPNPRAQAFYRKHRFFSDGTSRVTDGGMTAIRMIRILIPA